MFWHTPTCAFFLADINHSLTRTRETTNTYSVEKHNFESVVFRFHFLIFKLGFWNCIKIYFYFILLFNEEIFWFILPTAGGSKGRGIGSYFPPPHPLECKFQGSRDFHLVFCYISAQQVVDSQWIVFKWVAPETLLKAVIGPLKCQQSALGAFWGSLRSRCGSDWT